MKKFTLLFIALILGALMVNAQVPRNMVTVEIGTGTWCTYCPGAAMGADDMVANDLRVAIVENHNGDSYANTYSNARNTYYAISGFPTAVFDGGNKIVGGSHSTSMYPDYLAKYNTLINVQAPITLDYDVTQNGLQFTFNITVTRVGTLPSSTPVLHFCVTQSEIQQAWQGQTHLNFVNRKMIPDQNGTQLDFTSTDVQTVQIVANVDPQWPLENIEFVCFVQDNGTKQILDSGRPVMVDFEATTATTVCKNATISYANTSTGRPIENNWFFPGGTPNTSTQDNPVILYKTPGTYDVKLVTKTGLHYDTVLKEAYVTIKPGADVTTPAGPALICTNNAGQVTTYTTESPSAISFTWDLYPASAGTLTPGGSSATVSWNKDYYGWASIRVRGTNDCGVGDWSEYMDIACSNCTGVENEAEVSPLSVYPNPASKTLNVTLNGKVTEPVSMRIISTLGKVMYSENVVLNGKTQRSINVADLPEGLYFLHVNGKQFKSSQKITIDR